ncbi:MAG TPA: TRAM domain-containing protein [Armatimonadota bacterium]|nr:TRAM domain-containing protein [Armatimonadota bacterium]
MSRSALWTIFTLIFILSGAIGGTILAKTYVEALSTGQWPWGSSPPDAGVPETDRFLPMLALGIGGSLIGFLFWSLLCAELQRLKRGLDTMSDQDKIAVAVGLIIGMVLTVLIRSSFRPPTWVIFAVAVVVCYLGVAAALSMKEQFRIYVGGGSSTSGKSAASHILRPKLLDTNVIIDGRIADICKAGFVEGPIFIPRFVLEELQQIADSSDLLKRARGRRGLDILNGMQQEMSLQIQTYEAGNGGHAEDVDGRLVELAKELNGAIVTNDYNLNKVAGLQGVKVLNVNELANALKPVVLPGEEMSILIIKEGKEQNQGVGYLDDGTMVVVEGAKKYTGETLDVIVTSVLQTAAGKMIFANMSNENPEEDMNLERNIRSYTGSRPRRKIR